MMPLSTSAPPLPSRASMPWALARASLHSFCIAASTTVDPLASCAATSASCAAEGRSPCSDIHARLPSNSRAPSTQQSMPPPGVCVKLSGSTVRASAPAAETMAPAMGWSLARSAHAARRSSSEDLSDGRHDLVSCTAGLPVVSVPVLSKSTALTCSEKRTSEVAVQCGREMKTSAAQRAVSPLPRPPNRNASHRRSRCVSLLCASRRVKRAARTRRSSSHSPLPAKRDRAPSRSSRAHRRP
eukprot:6193634-Pleurochrysis_carterae.AAC.5